MQRWWILTNCLSASQSYSLLVPFQVFHWTGSSSLLLRQAPRSSLPPPPLPTHWIHILLLLLFQTTLQASEADGVQQQTLQIFQAAIPSEKWRMRTCGPHVGDYPAYMWTALMDTDKILHVWFTHQGNTSFFGLSKLTDNLQYIPQTSRYFTSSPVCLTSVWDVKSNSEFSLFPCFCLSSFVSVSLSSWRW